MIQTDSNALKAYIDAGWQLIPLHSWNYFDQPKGKKRARGKSPLHSNWTKRPYISSEQLAHMDAGHNVGVRLRETDLVIDVDPRNFEDKDDPFKRICADCGIDPDAYPTVHTGSGGLHLYMTKPADISIRDSLPDYRGVEFKTIGRQVVSAGSIHPDTKKLYEWDFLCPDLSEAPEAPTVLLNIIRRPTGVTSPGGGEFTQDELAKMLDVLDPEDFREHNRWFTLMQACHHATRGDGRSEFIEWSTRDPLYQDDGAIIGMRWDSLHAEAEPGTPIVTYRTLRQFLVEAGHADAMPIKGAEDDFEAVGPGDIPDDAGTPVHERKGPLERMNEKYIAVMEGNQFKIYWEQEDPDMFENGVMRKKWIRTRTHDFRSMLMNKRVRRGKHTITIADAWLEWSGRRQAKGVIFDPERDHKGFLNLWRGWAVEPSKNGSWKYLEELLFEVLCDGDETLFKYIMDWAAYFVQHPGKPAEVAICFQGGKGVGKGTWGRALAYLAGKHGMHITSPDQLTGRFNDHLRDVVLLFADEAIKPFDRDGESRLKGLITEPTLTYEGKGKDAQSGRNRLHIVMASNEDWVIPAGIDGERRFVLQRANNKRQGRHTFFSRLHKELNSGGYSALLWDLVDRDIEGWAPRENLPSTQAIVDQKIRGLSPIHQWWFNILHLGELPFELPKDEEDWAFDAEVHVFKDDVQDAFQDWCRGNRINPGSMGRSIDINFIAELKQVIPGLNTQKKVLVPDARPDIRAYSDGRAHAYSVPNLQACRDAMDAILGTHYNWDEA